MKNINPMPGGCKFSHILYEKVIKLCGYPKSIIELGCGNGGNLEEFSKSEKRVGIDPSEENINEALQKNLINCQFILGNHEDLKKFEHNSFDVGVTLSVLNHIKDFESPLTDMIIITKELVLLEPIKLGENRQATKNETFRWESTWYHDYQGFLEKQKVIYSIESCKLYRTNSGPLYKLIYIKKKGW